MSILRPKPRFPASQPARGARCEERPTGTWGTGLVVSVAKPKSEAGPQSRARSNFGVFPSGGVFPDQAASLSRGSAATGSTCWASPNHNYPRRIFGRRWGPEFALEGARKCSGPGSVLVAEDGVVPFECVVRGLSPPGLVLGRKYPGVRRPFVECAAARSAGTSGSYFCPEPIFHAGPTKATVLGHDENITEAMMMIETSRRGDDLGTQRRSIGRIANLMRSTTAAAALRAAE